MNNLRKYSAWWILALFFTLFGCSQYVKTSTERINKAYTVQHRKDDLVTHYTPLFLTYDYPCDFNRIGRPVANYDRHGQEHIYIDIQQPVIYYLVRKFKTDKATYTNYIYRIHFPEIPFSLIPFHLSAGNNVGLMVIVTVDIRNRPVLVSTVNTCGCFHSIVPTSHLPLDAHPENWKQEPMKVYGEKLPGILEYAEKNNPKLLVHIRPGVHRVMNLEIVQESDLYDNRKLKMITTPLAPVEELERLPINGKTTSFYYEEGLLKGHVKGSVKIWESIFLGLMSLDLFVGTDKVYADTQITENPFYTSLKPWNRNSSDMWNFNRFLKFWGWRL